MQVTEAMVAAAAKALAEAEATHDRKEPWINHAARAALSAALSIEQTELDASEWHRTDRPGGASVLLYTLREEGWRRGAAVLVNDVTVNIDRAHGSETDIEPIVQRVLSALVNAQADADVVEKARAYVASVSGGPEPDIWDTMDGQYREGATRCISDWAWKAYDEKKQSAFDELARALSSLRPAEVGSATTSKGNENA